MPATVTFVVDGLGLGGAEVHTLRLIKHLERSGVAVCLVVISQVRSPSITDDDLPRRTIWLNRGSMTTDLRGWLAAGQAIRSTNPRLVVGINEAAFSVCALAKLLRPYDAPLFCFLHTFEIATRSRRGIFKLLAKVAEGVVYVSANQREHWQRQGTHFRSDTVILNGINLQSFTPQPARIRCNTRRNLGLSDDDYVVGLVGGFRPIKRHTLLVDACAALRSEGIPIRLLMVGDGPTRPDVETRARDLGIAQDVMIVGEQRIVQPYLAAMDVMALASDSETMPLAAIEALACAVPVVLPDRGGATEIIDRGINGELFTPGDLRDLTRILRALADPERRRLLAARARPSVIGKFDESRMMAEYAAFLGSG